ncbi:MAG: hypothetical protein ACE5OZ_14875 [Candidatus Heimdallarchaeota archaeon]
MFKRKFAKDPIIILILFLAVGMVSPFATLDSPLAEGTRAIIDQPSEMSADLALEEEAALSNTHEKEFTSASEPSGSTLAIPRSTPALSSISITTLQKGVSTPYIPISAGLSKYYRFAVPFDSAMYKVYAIEYISDAASLNVDMYIKYNSLPTTTNYDVKRATGNSAEYYTKDVPGDDEYGTMYILVRCTSGAGHFRVWAYYALDGNGAWRTADIKATASTHLEYGVNKPISGALGGIDRNDFYKVYLYSGQILYIYAAVTASSGQGAVYIYDESHSYRGGDVGLILNRAYQVTTSISGWYYIRFYNPDSYSYAYSGYMTDLNSDPNNLYEDAILLTGTTGGSMSWGDINDYGYFWADSGEKITIDIQMTGTVSSMGYWFSLYAAAEPINANSFKSVNIGGFYGSSKTITYYCAEYPTSDIHPGTGNKVYLRGWNRARYYYQADTTSTFTITLTRSWPGGNERLADADLFTNWYTGTGTNSTDPADYVTGNLSGESDSNDWFQIPAKKGYTIDIGVNSSSTPNPFLDGYLVNSTGHVVKSDSYYNITMKFTARYTGDYYFRLYERPAAYQYGSYDGTSNYDWYIYTSQFDGNDNFTTAEELTPPDSVHGIVADPYDPDGDYYKVEVPSGYKIRGQLTGSSLHLSNLKLYLYDSAQSEVDNDTSVPQLVEAQNKKLSTETYYFWVEKVGAAAEAEYTLTVLFIKLGSDDDMADATPVSVGLGDNATGTNSLSATDINDYYSFEALSGDKLLVNVTGTNGYVVRLVMNDSSSERLLVEKTISGGSAAFEYYPHTFYPETTYYLRVCNPDGAASGSYDWNITRIEFDTEDGYFSHSTPLEAGQSATISGSLSASDANDWYMIWLRSGEEIEVELTTSTLADPHAGFEFVTFLYREIFDDGATVEGSLNNTWPVQLPIYIQVVNEAGSSGSYTLTVTVNAIDSDNNGLPETAPALPLNADTPNELSFTDLNDMYAVEIRSGYNLTIHFELDSQDNFTRQPLGCILLDEDLMLLDFLYSNDTGTLTYTNPNLEPISAYVQFYNVAPLYGFNSTESYGKFMWNATLVNDDPDGDFNKATVISGPTDTASDSLFANLTYPTHNLSDINDFYEVSLAQGGVLSVSVTVSGVTDPWFGIYIYKASEVMLANATGSDDLTLLFNAGDFAGDYYIRIYNDALAAGTYVMAVSISTDADSYFGGATQVTPGAQTANSLGTSDILDLSSIDLQTGWRLKVNATIAGTSPDVDLLLYDPDQAGFAGNFTGTDYLEIEVTANSSGTFYIAFYNTGATEADYDWWIYVYEDENGHISTATSIGSGDRDDSVQELDKYDYFAVTGESGDAFTITSSLPTGLTLELYLYNSTGGLIDSDLTTPGLAVTHTAASTDTFYILFTNPNGDTGDYTFSVSGAGEPPDLPGPSQPADSSESVEDDPITLLDEDIGDYKVWQWGVGALVGLFLLLFLKRKLFGGKK